LVIDLKLKIKLKKDFWLFFILGVLIFLFYLQYSYLRENLIESYKSKAYRDTIQIRDRFKTVITKAELVFKTKLTENMRVLRYLVSLYKDIDTFNADKVAYLLNKYANDKDGYYQVFVIDKNYKIIKASYKPDLGLDLGNFSEYKNLFNQIFNEDKKIDVSYLIFDYSSFTLKRYFLILAPDKKHILELAYVVDIYPSLKSTYYNVLSTYREVNKINLYFMDKYLIYPVNLSYRYQIKLPIEKIIKNTKNFFLNLGVDKEKLLKELSKKVILKFNLKNHYLVAYTIQEGLFKTLFANLLIEIFFDTYNLEKDLEHIRRQFIFALVALILSFLFFRIIIFYISSTLSRLVTKMKRNEAIEQKGFFIKEIDDLVSNYNHYRERLNREIEKNKELLLENKRFIVDTVHQLKTPLSIINLNSNYLKMILKDKEAEEILDEIEAAIAMLTNSYEDLSYLSANKVIEYKPVNLNISDVLKERINFFTPLAKTRGKKLIYDIDENIYFNINKVEFERLVDNNISNAIEYSKKDEIKIFLKRKECVILNFISYGDEIKNPKRLFEKNYREKEYKRGLGIGLNIVKNICDKYGIKYEVISKNGKNEFKYIFCYNFNKK